MRWIRGAVVLAMIIVPTNRAMADLPIYGTGVDNNGNVLAGGSTDTHYTVAGPGISGSINPVVVTDPASHGWVGNTSSSAWISPTAGADNGVFGTFTYTTTFSLSASNVSTAQLTGQIAGDDSAEIFLNGVDTGISGTFNVLTAFTIASGFITGTNSLAFVVPNVGGGTGLQVSISETTTATPEPSTFMVAIVGALGMIAYGQRRRKAKL